jgi:murein DD-endopeptidase
VAIVPILRDTYLVHELWITSRLSTTVTLDQVTVLDDDRALASYAGATLHPLVGRPGLPRTHPERLVLERDQPAVVYFWIRLEAGTPVPPRVRHRARLQAAASGGAARPIVVEGGSMLVSTVDPDVLDAPLRGSGWAAIYEPSMIGGHRTAIYTVDDKPRIPGRFAIDWIRLPPSGRAHTDASSRPPDWNGFGADVLAVKDARVAAAVDGHPDADPSGKPRVAISRDNAAGNYIALDLGNGRFAFYEHLQQGSVGVKAGDRVASGQTIARVGSSGSVSSGPHLHFHVADTNATLGAEGLPFVLREFRLRGAFPSIGAFASGEAPSPVSPGLEPARARERPGPNAVVDFPGLP